ncbi:hypothetical protein KBY47_08530 [Streptomyces sp. B93]|nr:hypothetical protein [Streptomyces sp. B93]
MRRTLSRLRIQRTYCPRPALVLIDTPRPDCPDCQGTGGISYDYGNPATGEYEGTDIDFCDCWTARPITLLPLPRWPHRTPRRYSDEPPF